jgi:hypothetical protein
MLGDWRVAHVDANRSFSQIKLTQKLEMKLLETRS